jgi:hypothetical protein
MALGLQVQMLNPFTLLTTNSNNSSNNNNSNSNNNSNKILISILKQMLNWLSGLISRRCIPNNRSILTNVPNNPITLTPPSYSPLFQVGHPLLILITLPLLRLNVPYHQMQPNIMVFIHIVVQINKIIRNGVLNLHTYAVKLPLPLLLSTLLPLTAEHHASVQQVRVKPRLVQGSQQLPKIHALVQAAVLPQTAVQLLIHTTAQRLPPPQILQLPVLPYLQPHLGVPLPQLQLPQTLHLLPMPVQSGPPRSVKAHIRLRKSACHVMTPI